MQKFLHCELHLQTLKNLFRVTISEVQSLNKPSEGHCIVLHPQLFSRELVEQVATSLIDIAHNSLQQPPHVKCDH